MTHLINSILVDREMLTVSLDMSIRECALIMKDRGIGALPVKNEATGEIIGILSERDMICCLIASNGKVDDLKASDVACRKMTILNAREPIEKAMTAITETKRRHVLIEQDGEVIGILSIGDLMKNVLDEKTVVIEHLENYIHS